MRPPATLLAIALTSLVVAGGLAAAQSTSTTSTSASTATSTSTSLASSDVLGAIALGAGSRARVDRDDFAALAAIPFLASDPCVSSVRERRGELVPVNMRIDQETQVLVADALFASGGVLTQQALADAFEGERIKLVITDCESATAMPVSDVITQRCVQTGRGCPLALLLRMLLDADGVDDVERELAFGAIGPSARR